MEYLESEYAATRGRQPYDDARRALLACSSTAIQLAEKITRKLKNKECIDDVLNKCIAGGKPQPWKELCELAETVGEMKGIFNDAMRAEEKRKEREEKKRLRAEANAAAKAAEVVPVEAPKARPTKVRDGKQKIPKVIKDEIWDYYIGNDIAQVKCPCCQKTPITMREFVAGHVLSEKLGGAITCQNLVPICNKCNSSMGTRHMVEFTIKHWGRKPVCPRNQIVYEDAVPEVILERTKIVKDEATPDVSRPKYTRYDHCRAFSCRHTDAGRFPSDEEAIAHAQTKGYVTIIHKANSSAMYYFTDKPGKKCKVARSEEERGWDFVSWRLE